MIKLKHRAGYFGTTDVVYSEEFDAGEEMFLDDDNAPYYLEFTESPFKLVCIHLNGDSIDITTNFDTSCVRDAINDGSWVEFE